MQVAVELPNDWVVFEGEGQLRRDIQLSYAIWLYQAGRVTISKAAELAGLDIYDFMSVCKEHRIPVIDMESAELLQEVEA